MARTALLCVAPSALIAWNWLRLEDPRPGGSLPAWMVVMALLPALLPRLRLRMLAAVAAAILAAHAALDVGFDARFASAAVGRFDRGFLEFYDVRLPFDATAHPRMDGVILLAIFAFCLAVSLAVAARRPVVAALALLIGAGWPATLLTGGDDLRRGSLLLAVLLSLFLGLAERPRRRLGPALAGGSAVVLAAFAASTSTAVAKGELLHWQAWDFYTRPAKPVDVAYVWNSDYRGFRFPRKRTIVFRVKAPPNPTYWRATALNAFLDGRWEEDPILRNVDSDPSGSIVEFAGLPQAARNSANWVRQDVTIEALEDDHLVAANVPVAYEDEGLSVAYTDGGASASTPLPRGQHFAVWSYLPRPTPRQLARSKPLYPAAIARDHFYLQIERGVSAPPFSTAGRERAMARIFRGYPAMRPYLPLYETALRVVGGRPASPYAAAVAIEGWLREGGQFVYDQHPPIARRLPPLVDFVTRTHRGYCQHFAGTMALMLRYLGVPARVAAGFTSGRYYRRSGTWDVSDHEAHTWVEVWFRGYGWLPFDPTPGRGELGGRYTTASPTFDVPGAKFALTPRGHGRNPAFDPTSAGNRRGNQFPLIRDVPRRGEGGRASASGGSLLGGLLRLLAIVAAAAFVLVCGSKLVVRLPRRFVRDPRRVAGACRRDLVDFLIDQGADVPAAATLGELGAAVEAEYGIDPRPFVAAATLARFGPPPSAAAAAVRARRELRELRRLLRRQLTLFERAWGLVSLRSLGLAA